MVEFGTLPTQPRDLLVDIVTDLLAGSQLLSDLS
jgi:hypothetical protein